MANKEFHEMTKKELHKIIRQNNKDMRRIANGTASDHDMMDYSVYYAIRDENRRIVSALIEKGTSAADIALHDAAINLAYKANKTLEKKLGY